MMKERIDFNDNHETIQVVIHTLLEDYGVSIEDYAYSHKALTCTIRSCLWLWIYEKFDVSTCFLGGLFARNHATIIVGMRRARWLLDAHDKTTTEVMDKILLIDKLLHMDKNKMIYISLPSSEDEEANKKRAERATAKFKAQGFEHVVTSYDMLYPCISENKREEWIGRRISQLLLASVAVFANGWYEDKICLLEKDACQRFGIETFTDGKI